MGAVLNCSCLGREVKVNGTEVMRIVKYNYKAGKENEVKALNDKLIDLFKANKPDGIMEFAFSTPTPLSICGLMVFDSQANLDAYKKGLREKLLADMKDVLAGPAEYDLDGTVMKAFANCPSRTEQTMLRTLKYKYKKMDTAEMNKKMEEVWPLLAAANVTIWSAWLNAEQTEAIIGMLAPSQEELDNYKKTTREKAMAIAGDMFDGPPPFETVGALFRPDAFP